MNEHLHHILAFEELNVGCTADERVEVGLLDSEVNIYPIQNV